MTTSEFETDRRGLIGATLGALTIVAVSGAASAPAAKPRTTIRKAPAPRGSYGIVLPGIKRTAFLNASAGMSSPAFQDHWISTYARCADRPGVSAARRRASRHRAYAAVRQDSPSGREEFQRR
jgi:hypothetical protein